MIAGYHVHLPLLDRLKPLVQQRSFCDSPDLGWVTANWHDPAGLDHLLAVAKVYGVRRLILDIGESKEPLDPIAEKIRSAGLRFGICTWTTKQGTFESFPSSADIDIYDETSPILDAVGLSVGAGKLPYLFIDQLIRRVDENLADHQPVLLRIDRPNSPGESLATWGNVFGVSFHLLAGQSDPADVESIYQETCFGPGDAGKRIFDLSKVAVDKSFRTLKCFEMMDRSCWPMDLAWYDRQLDQAGDAHPLYAPRPAQISEIDFEKIEALEAAHDAWQLLEKTGDQLSPRGFLWLEHHLLHLKTVCMVLRMLARGYFKLRGRQTGKMTLGSHVVRSIHKELYETMCNRRAILGEFSIIETRPLEGILAGFQRDLDTTNDTI
jgi:hypothetical protein